MLGTVADASSLTLGLPILLFPSLPLLRRDCSWSNSKSSSRWVRASFCWIAMRSREFRVFFSSSAAASCLCISSSCVTYSSHLWKNRAEIWGNGPRTDSISEHIPGLQLQSLTQVSALLTLILAAGSPNSSVPIWNKFGLGRKCQHVPFSKTTCAYISIVYDNVTCF